MRVPGGHRAARGFNLGKGHFPVRFGTVPCQTATRCIIMYHHVSLIVSILYQSCIDHVSSIFFLRRGQKYDTTDTADTCISGFVSCCIRYVSNCIRSARRYTSIHFEAAVIRTDTHDAFVQDTGPWGGDFFVSDTRRFFGCVTNSTIQHDTAVIRLSFRPLKK